MSFKNALKNLVAHFGVVWAILLYFIIFAAIITGLSLPFILPVAREFVAAGVFESLRGAFSSLFGNGGWQGLWDGLYATYASAMTVFETNDRMASLIIAFLIFVVIVAFRFFLGLCDIPLMTVLDGQLSCNAHYGLGGKFFSTLSVSVRFSLMKMIYTVLADAAVFGILYGFGTAIGMTVALPFVVIFTLAVLSALRYSVTSCWAACVASGECGVIKGFFRSAKICFKNFGSVYSTYIVSFILLFALGAFITIFTLGVGLIIVVPLCIAYNGYLGITVYYNKTCKNYYVDGAVISCRGAERPDEK